MVLPSRSRVYTDVVLSKPAEYSAFDDMKINWEDQDKFEIIQKLGNGKFSDAFQCINIETQEFCVAKVLKPVRKNKVKREIKILLNLKDGINIIKLHAIVRNSATQIPSLILEYISNTDARELYFQFTPDDIKYYLMELLKALNYCHSMGIMHRDVKPHNIIIDHKKRKLRLIDWGLAEFYRPGEEYSVRVASRYYKAPELLVGHKMYDYSMDMWSVGCLFAAMIFRLDPFFCGNNNVDQLLKISMVLGTDKLIAYLKKYSLKFNDVDNKRWPEKSLYTFCRPDIEHLATKDAIDLLDKLLQYDHYKRLTAAEAINHNYFISTGNTKNEGSPAKNVGDTASSKKK